MKEINSAILLTNDDFSYASNLKTILKDNCYELIYTKQFEKLIDFATTSKHAIIFIDNYFSMYKSIFKFFFEKSECFRNHVVVFIDENVDKYKEFVNDVRIFALNKNKIESSLLPILQNTVAFKQTATDINCNKLNEYLTSYLLKIGFNPKHMGFDYIKKLVIYCANNNNFAPDSLQRSIFPKLAIICNKQVASIERNIRSAVKHASLSQSFIEEFAKHGVNLNKNITTKTFLSFLLNKCYDNYISKNSLNKQTPKETTENKKA